MKYLIFTALLFLQLSLFAQSGVPPEKVFVQTDRNVYTVGDTIHFRAYVSNTLSGKFEGLSTSLYCLLFDRYGRTADSARFRLNKSGLSGWLTVPLYADSGTYTLVSFTSSMMNGDPRFAFRTPVKIVYRTTQTKSINKTNPVKKNDAIAQLEFYPEGGRMIYDQQQLIAFTALDSSSEFHKVEGSIFNEYGDVITRFKTNESGVGVFQIIPDSGMFYYALLNGCTERKWPLPHAYAGMCLNVINTFRDLLYVQVRSNLARNPACRLLLVENYDTVIVKDIHPGRLYETTIETDKLVPGMARLILTDNNNQALAERSVFVNFHKVLNLNFEMSASRGNSLIKIKPVSQSDSQSDVMLTISVIDSAKGCDYGLHMPDILSSMLFDPRFCKKLPRSIIEKGLFSLDPKSVDELLMTFSPVDNDEIILAPLNRYNEKIQITYTGHREIEEISCLIPQTAAILKFNTANNEAIIPLDSIDPEMNELYLLKTRKIRNFDSLKVDYLIKKEFFWNAKLNEPGMVLPIKKNEPHYTKTDSLPGDKAIYFDAVTVKGKKKSLGVVDARLLYPTGNVKTYEREDIEHCLSFESMLWKLHPLSINRAKRTVLLRAYPTFTNVDVNALFVVDGNKIGHNYFMLEDMPVENIESISVLKGQLSYNMYGALNGIIFVTTRYGVNDYGSSLRANPPKAIPVFRNQSSPGQSGKSLVVKEVDNPTIIRADEVILKDREACTVSFPGNMPAGTYIIRVNAVSMDHSAGSAMYYFRKK